MMKMLLTVVAAFVSVTALPAVAQSIVDCEVVDRQSVPDSLHRDARYSVELAEGVVRLLLRREVFEVPEAISMTPHWRVPGASYNFTVTHTDEASLGRMYQAAVRADGTILLDYFGETQIGLRRGDERRLTALLRCPAR